jgi:hypothetical protein
VLANAVYFKAWTRPFDKALTHTLPSRSRWKNQDAADDGADRRFAVLKGSARGVRLPYGKNGHLR